MVWLFWVGVEALTNADASVCKHGYTWLKNMTNHLNIDHVIAKSRHMKFLSFQ